MFSCLFLVNILIAAALAETDAQNISTVLLENGITRWPSLLESNPSIYDRFEQANVTVLVPTDAAFSKYQNFPNSTEEIDEILRYHALQGVVPGKTLNGPKTFLPTLLFNDTATNVTGGQVVEAFGLNGDPVLYSGRQSQSKVLKTDVFYNNGGIFHIIDTILTPPGTFTDTIASQNLTDLVALASQAGLIGHEALDIGNFFNNAADLTFFAPNNYDFANVAGFGNLTEEGRDDLAFYHLVQGPILYSSVLEDGATFRTLAGKNITITVVDGSTYVNSAKVTTLDLLTFNGVMHLIDSPLNPDDPSARPDVANVTSNSHGSSHKSGLGTGAIAGIAVGGYIIGLVIALFAFIMYRRRRNRNRLQSEPAELESYDMSKRSFRTYVQPTRPSVPVEIHTRPVHELESREVCCELDAGGYDKQKESMKSSSGNWI